MTESESKPLRVITLATYFKGGDFIRECKRRGCGVVLVTKEKMLHEDWPRESLDDLIALPDDADTDLFLHLAAFLGRQTRIDRVVALEEFDVITAALVREHLCLPGLSSSAARVFRDKLAMSHRVRAAGLDVPDFVSLINHGEVNDFVARVPPPWIIKPRSDVSAIGIRKAQEPGDVWRAIDELDARERMRERSSYYLLARFIPGQVFHVDSIVDQGNVVFAGVNQYGRPPLEVAHLGGAYLSHSVTYGSDEETALRGINRKLVQAFGLERGATHAEFIRSEADGHFYFLEIAARVGGAYIAEVLEAASGINLWREWARIETSPGASAAEIKPEREEYAGIILSLARQEFPDTSAYQDAEIVYRVRKRHHVGLIVQSPRHDRVTELLGQYAHRFAQDFVAVVPPRERPE
jgi:biotin carboxylase